MESTPERTRKAPATARKRTEYPLPALLTRRVVDYLNVFRIVIAAGLITAFQADILIRLPSYTDTVMMPVVLAAYLSIGVMLLLISRRPESNCYALARTSLLTDILFLSLFYILFGGMESGLGVLLIFISASASILLPLRLALFIAALAAIVVVGGEFIQSVLWASSSENLLGAGLYGFTIFLTTVLVHLLAYWARDYRLTAERQQRRLTRLEQINELIIRRMRGGVLAVDQHGVIQLINESAWFLLGSPGSTDRVLKQVSPELFDALDAWRREPGEDPEPLSLTASQAKVVPKFVDLPGESEISVLIFLEDNDIVAQRALELSTQSLAKLSGSIAHEIRNPLAAISHAGQLLGESDALQSADRRLVEIISKQSRRMNDIVENILQLSRREKSRPDLIEISPWLHALWAEFCSSVTGRDLRLRLEVEESESLVLFDRSQLHQALWKLLENAVEHATDETSGPEVILRMSRQDAAGYCVISVENNGHGITEEQLPHVFEPFFTTRKKGSGLGLYVARQLCEANQAEITVDSTPGWKTRFHIRLALAGTAESEDLLEQDLAKS